MIQNKLKSVVVIIVVALTITSSVFATDGYFRHGYGIKYSALAGSGVAVSLSSLGAISNPAGILFINDRYDINISYFSPSREYTITVNASMMQGTFGLTPGTIKSDNASFFFPTLGAKWSLNKSMAVGIVIYGNGGMNTEYPTMTFYDPNSPATGTSIFKYKGVPSDSSTISNMF